MRLIDPHAHLQHDRFSDDVEAVLADARAAGLERLLVPGWDVASSERAVAFAREFGVDAAAGVHPHLAGAADESAWRRVAQLAAEREVVAVGETGLDYDRAYSPRAAQLDNLRRQLGLAAELELPIILHCRSQRGARDAQDELLRELRAGPPVRAVIHSYSGPLDYGEGMLELGATLSFSGLVFRGGEEPSAELARRAPADCLLVETDSPYLPAPGAPRRRNTPRWVGLTARWLAERRGADPLDLGDRLVANYDALFRRR